MARKSTARGRAALTEDVADRLHFAATDLVRRLRRDGAAVELSPARLGVLSCLQSRGPVTLGALAQAEQVAAPTMTRLIQALEQDGFARRRPDPEDRRATLVHITSRGRRSLDRARRHRRERLVRLMSELSHEEIARLDDAAAVIRTMLD